jgi:hypothetical protein
MMPRGYRDEDEKAEGYAIEDCRGLRLSRSGAAIEVEMDDGTKDWVPLSQIHDDSEVFEPGGSGRLVVTKWLAEQRGWV